MANQIKVVNRIGGKQLSQHLDTEVILLGEIKRISSTGKAIELLTTDNVSVNVSLPEPIEGAPEGFIEIHGTALSRSTVTCKNYIIFPSELTEEFENDTFNAYLSTVHVLGDKKWLISSSDTPY